MPVRCRLRAAVAALACAPALLLAGCGGGTGEPASGGSGPLQVDGRIVYQGQARDGVDILMVPGTDSGVDGYASVSTSGGGTFSISTNWSSGHIVAQQGTLVGFTDFAQSRTGQTEIHLEDIGYLATQPPPAGHSEHDVVTFDRTTRAWPVVFARIARAIYSATRKTATYHFVARLIERGIPLTKAVDVLRNGQKYYDPQQNSYVRYKDNVAIILNDAQEKLITIYEGPVKAHWIPR